MYLEILNLNSQKIQEISTDKKLIFSNDDISAVKLWLMQFSDKKNTLANYRKEVERFLLWCSDKHKTLKDLLFEDIMDYRKFCEDPKPYDKWVSTKRYARSHALWRPFGSTSGLSKNSIKLTETTLSSMFTWLCHAGYLNKNPFKLQKRIQKSKSIVYRYLDEDLWQAILHAINYNFQQAQTPKKLTEAIRLKWIISLFYLTGIRISEAITNYMHSFIQENYEGKTSWWLHIIGKGNKMRKIPIHDDLIEILQLYRTKCLNLSPLPLHNETNIPLVCKINQGIIEEITRASMHNWVKNIFEVAKKFILSQAQYTHLHDKVNILNKASAHWIRHTTWTHMANKNIDLRFIRDNAGHASISTTSIYLHSEDRKRHEESLKHNLGDEDK